MKSKYFMYSKNTALEYQSCNLSFAHLLGFKRSDDVIGKHDSDLPFVTECAEQIHCYDTEVIQTGSPKYNLSHVIRLNDNTMRVVTADRFPIFDSEKKIVGVFAVLVDDTQLPLVDQIFLNHILTHLPYYVFWKDKESTYLGANTNFAKLTGRKTGKEVVGLTDYDLGWGKGEAELFQTADKQVIEGNSYQINEEEILKRPDGSEITMLVSKVPVKNNEGDTLGMIGISTDITQLKQTEQDLKKAQQQAETASAAKSEFIANMSHDLRTPITGILGLVQDLINAAEEAQASLQKPHDTTEHAQSKNNASFKNLATRVQKDGYLLMGATDELLQFCNEVLEVVCLETGKPSEQLESFNFHELVRHNIELLQPTAQHKKLNLSYEIAANMPTFLKGLAIYLDRSLLNLISNALKFTETGFVKVTARLADSDIKTPRVGDTVTVQLMVKDTGVGIPEDKFTTIFEHFSRLTSSYQGVYKGAGLGLYTVKRYVEAMQGRIKVDSEEGKGTCFTLTLPFTVSDYADRKKEPFRSPKPATPAPDIHAIKEELATPVSKENAAATILLVEDSKLAVMAVKVSLKSLGCAVDVAESGAQAVSMATRNQYDLIFMDIGLPDFTGIAAAKKIRALSDPAKANVPIVALTGHAGNLDKRQEALDAGMQDVLNKPAQSVALKSILERYVFKKSDEQPVTPIATNDTTSRPEPAVLDWKASVRMAQGNTDTARELLALLATELKKTGPQLATDYANNNIAALRDALHQLRGGVCYVKVPQLEYTLEALHNAVKATPLDSLQLEKTHAELQYAIQRFLKTWETGNF